MSVTGTTVAVIPARFQSSRFPGKPLASIAGKTMIEWVYGRAAAAAAIDEVVVATDHPDIAATVRDFGGTAVMTSPNHASGTDRVAEAVADRDADLVVNLQGDEPLLPPEVIDALVAATVESGAPMGTVAVPLGPNSDEAGDANRVKVVTDAAGDALYFSRSLIPYNREGGVPVSPLWHWGIYAFRRDCLERFVSWPPGRLEQCEKLEQLRALEHGVRIHVMIHRGTPAMGVDVPEDVARVERLLNQRGEAAHGNRQEHQNYGK